MISYLIAYPKEVFLGAHLKKLFLNDMWLYKQIYIYKITKYI